MHLYGVGGIRQVCVLARCTVCALVLSSVLVYTCGALCGYVSVHVIIQAPTDTSNSLRFRRLRKVAQCAIRVSAPLTTSVGSSHCVMTRAVFT